MEWASIMSVSSIRVFSSKGEKMVCRIWISSGMKLGCRFTNVCSRILFKETKWCGDKGIRQVYCLDCISKCKAIYGNYMVDRKKWRHGGKCLKNGNSYRRMVVLAFEQIFRNIKWLVEYQPMWEVNIKRVEEGTTAFQTTSTVDKSLALESKWCGSDVPKDLLLNYHISFPKLWSNGDVLVLGSPKIHHFKKRIVISKSCTLE